MSSENNPKIVVITGAAGQIGYSLTPLVAKGIMLGKDQPVILHLLEIEPAMPILKALHMELIDSAYPLLKGVVLTTDAEVAFKDADYVLFVGAFPRKDGMERKDLIGKNAQIFSSQGKILDRVAKKTVKVVVVGNPANTNCLITLKNAPSIPKENFTCLTRLDHNRSIGHLAEKAGAPVSSIKNTIIWGNHSSTQFPDTRFATKDDVLISKFIPKEWLEGEFVTTIQQRGAAVIKARGGSSALSAANAIIDHVHDWVLGTPRNEWVSMGVLSDGSYGIKDELIFSYPVVCKNGSYSIVTGLKIDEFTAQKIEATTKELIEEKKIGFELTGIKE